MVDLPRMDQTKITPAQAPKEMRARESNPQLLKGRGEVVAAKAAATKAALLREPPCTPQGVAAHVLCFP